jgi:hypothetical protein
MSGMSVAIMDIDVFTAANRGIRALPNRPRNDREHPLPRAWLSTASEFGKLFDRFARRALTSPEIYCAVRK